MPTPSRPPLTHPIWGRGSPLSPFQFLPLVLSNFPSSPRSRFWLPHVAVMSLCWLALPWKRQPAFLTPCIHSRRGFERLHPSGFGTNTSSPSWRSPSPHRGAPSEGRRLHVGVREVEPSVSFQEISFI